MMLLFNLIIPYLFSILIFPAFSLETPEETANIIEGKLSQFEYKELYSKKLKYSNFHIILSKIKPVLTYPSKTIKRNDILYDKPVIYYYFCIEVLSNPIVQPVIKIRRQFLMKLKIDYLCFIQNESGIYSVNFPSDTPAPDADFDNESDLMNYELFTDLFKELPHAISAFLLGSFESSLVKIVKENFPSNHEYLFQKFIQIISNKYHIVEKEPFSDWPERVQFNKITYASVSMKSRYTTLFSKINLIAEFNYSGAQYSTNIQIKSISFGMFGLTFDTISTLFKDEFLKIIIPQIFNREFINCNFDFKEFS